MSEVQEIEEEESIEAPPVSPNLRYLIVVAAMIGAVLEVLDTSITNVAIPQMQGNLGATISEIGWVNTGYIISNVIVLPITGWLSDRFGRRNYFAASIALFTIASLFCGWSHTLSQLIFWRLVQGFGGGGLLSTGQVIMLRAFPKSQQGTATAIFGMGVMIGPSLGPVLGGYLTDNFSWPWIFFVNLPFGIAASILTMLYVPNEEGPTRQSAKIDFAGFLLLALGMGSLQTVLERGQQDDWFSAPLIVGLTLTSIIGLVGFVWWELTVEDPIVNLRVFRNRSLTAGSLFGAILGIGLYAVLFLLPIYLQNSQNYTAFETGMILLPSALVSMVSFVAAGILSQQVDPRALLAGGTVLFLLSAFGLSHLSTDSGAPDVFWPLMARGLSLGFLFIPLTVSSLGNLKPDEIGVGSGMINLTRQLGGSIGIAAASTILTQRIDFHRSILVSQMNQGTDGASGWLLHAQNTLIGYGYSAASAHLSALGQLTEVVEEQCSMLAFNDAFVLIFVAFLAALPLILLFERPRADTDISAAH